MRKLLGAVAAPLLLSLLGASPAVGAIPGELNYGVCASCHGAAGEGDGLAGIGLVPPPTNFAACGYRIDADGDTFLATDDDLFLVARDGAFAYGGSGFMPAFGVPLGFTDPELLDIISYIRTLEPIPCPEPDRRLLSLSAFGSLLVLGAFRRTRVA